MKKLLEAAARMVETSEKVVPVNRALYRETAQLSAQLGRFQAGIGGLLITSYELLACPDELTRITLERCRGIDQFTWGISSGGHSWLCKEPSGEYFDFVLVPPGAWEQPSYKTCRWDTADAALEFWLVNRQKILALPSEQRRAQDAKDTQT